MSNLAHHLNGERALLGPDIYDIMENAFERACNSLVAPLSVHKVLARKILELIQKGERDPAILCHKALASLQVQGKCQ